MGIFGEYDSILVTYLVAVIKSIQDLSYKMTGESRGKYRRGEDKDLL